MFRFSILLVQVNQKIIQEVFSPGNVTWGLRPVGRVQLNNCISLLPDSDVISDGAQVLFIYTQAI